MNYEYETEERAAIYEFDAGMPRAEAERRAYGEVADKAVCIPADMMKPDGGMTQMEMLR